MGNDNKRKGAGILLFHFPLVRDATSRCSSSCFGSMFSFPACTRDATSYLEASIDDNIFISRLYARCNDMMERWTRGELCFHFPLVREMQLKPPGKPTLVLFISRLYARCNTSPTTAYVYFTFSFPACTRDATFNIWPYLSLCCFHFPLVREMQPSCSPAGKRRTPFFISRLYARCNAAIAFVISLIWCFHFPLVREMQLHQQWQSQARIHFHFPPVREMQLFWADDGSSSQIFHFPLVREMQH